jgi:hypothetical protein
MSAAAAERLALLDDLPAEELCRQTSECLEALVSVMNEETTLLRAGKYKECSAFTSAKTRLAQDYVGFVRAVQRRAGALRKDAPAAVAALRQGHEKLATQMAENLRVIATARLVTQDLLTDVAVAVGAQGQTRTYGAGGEVAAQPIQQARGIAINRAL